MFASTRQIASLQLEMNKAAVTRTARLIYLNVFAPTPHDYNFHSFKKKRCATPNHFLGLSQQQFFIRADASHSVCEAASAILGLTLFLFLLTNVRESHAGAQFKWRPDPRSSAHSTTRTREAPSGSGRHLNIRCSSTRGSLHFI